MITLKQLIHAKALIDHTSFRKVARIKNISQPALSRSIASLEESLGIELFNRHPTGVSNTVYGKTLKKYVEQILTAVNELEREIQLIKQGGLGELAVALGPYPAELSGHRAIGRLLASFPETKCKVIVSGWEEVEEIVINRQVDLGLAELSQVSENSDLATVPLANHQAVIFCRAGHPLSQKTSISKKDLNRWPLVLTKVPSRLTPHIPGKMYMDKHSEHLFPSIQIEDISLSKQIVKESDAISIATPIIIERELENNTFSILPYESSHLMTNYGFMYLHDRTLSPVAETFMNLVKEVERDVHIHNQELIMRYFG